MADTQRRKIDPIRRRYFAPLERAERIGDGIFYVAAILSVLLLIVDRESHSAAYLIGQAVFLLCAILGFTLTLGVRLYWGPRAQDRRTDDFLSSVYRVRLTHERTTGYYNNEEGDASRRLAAQTLENSLFSKEIALAMCRDERARLFLYSTIWLIALFNRNTPIDIIVAISQALFSEQLLAKWIRIEWLRARFEATYDTLYKLFQHQDKNQEMFAALATESYVKYETAKANAAITLSGRKFEALNTQLSAEWEVIKRDLAI